MMNGCDQLNMSNTSAATTHSQSLFTQLRNGTTTNNNNNLYLMHPHHDLSYSQIPPPSSSSSVQAQYPQQNFISNVHHNHIKPLMLNTGYDHENLSVFPTPTTTDYDHHQSMQVKQFMSRDDCETSASPTAAAAGNYHHQQACEPGIEECDQTPSQTLQVTRDDHNQSLNEWDRLVITTSNHHHQDADPASINHQCLRSEMDFWAYGK